MAAILIQAIKSNPQHNLVNWQSTRKEKAVFFFQTRFKIEMRQKERALKDNDGNHFEPTQQRTRFEFKLVKGCLVCLSGLKTKML